MAALAAAPRAGPLGTGPLRSFAAARSAPFWAGRLSAGGGPPTSCPPEACAARLCCSAQPTSPFPLPSPLPSPLPFPLPLPLPSPLSLRPAAQLLEEYLALGADAAATDAADGLTALHHLALRPLGGAPLDEAGFCKARAGLLAYGVCVCARVRTAGPAGVDVGVGVGVDCWAAGLGCVRARG